MESANNIYVINLLKDKDRMEIVSKEFNKYSIKFKRFDAVYGKNLTDKEINDKVSFIGKNLLCHHSMVGCFLSHVNLWKKLVDDKENDFYLIFEDDFVIKDFDSISKLYDAYNEKRINKDFLSLFVMHTDICMSNIDEINGVKICKKIFPFTLVGYFITKKRAINLLNRLGDKIYYHIDISLVYLSKLYKDCEIYNTYNNLINLNNEGILKSNNTGNLQKKTILSLMPPDKYFPFQSPALTIKMKHNISTETLLFFILSILFYHLSSKHKNIFYYLLFIITFTNFILSLF
jgi:GR25 family glycosyltransferase involved in LPS biosynthesis